jgi:flagellar biogenesis protein FliO
MMPEAASDAPFSMVALIALVGLVVAGLLWWQRSRTAVTGGDAIRLVSVRGLGGKRLLALVEVERERFLLGLTDESIACLARVAPQSGPALSGDDARATDAERTWAKQSA